MPLFGLALILTLQRANIRLGALIEHFKGRSADMQRRRVTLYYSQFQGAGRPYTLIIGNDGGAQLSSRPRGAANTDDVTVTGRPRTGTYTLHTTRMDHISAYYDH